MKITMLLVSAAFLAAIVLNPSSAPGQGTLTPSGSPAPTMKSLGQVEPRTPLDGTNTPGNSVAQFVIAQPGSYYLTGNVVGVGERHGIFISANDVTLDLGGFAMTGTSNSYDGIAVTLGCQNIVIRNGTLRNWAIGVVTGGGPVELEQIRVYGSQSQGFYLGNQSKIKNCEAVSNRGSGMQMGDACVVTDCLVSSNCAASQSDVGILGGSDCVVSGCLVIGNAAAGMSLGDNCSISKCTSEFNADAGLQMGDQGRIFSCLVNSNGSGGIDCGLRSFVKDCTANGNDAGPELISGGINVEDGSVVLDNIACDNGDSGIVTLSFGSRIENNQTYGNQSYGINSLLGPNADVIIRNTSRDNAFYNYFPTSGSTFAPVESPATATNSWANF